MRHVVVWKKRGETPLMALRAWQHAHPRYRHLPATYAGRLDPMAEGKLLILLGEECKRKERYMALDKEYEIEVLLDMGSDTGDALGLMTYTDTHTTYDRQSLMKILRQEQGAQVRPYPHFSSKTVQGKPLFLHALEGSLEDTPVPTHTETIYRIDLLGARTLSLAQLKSHIELFLRDVPRAQESSKRLGADFRINEVRARWDDVCRKAGERDFVLVRLRVACASGTYMRTLAQRMGKALHTKAIALSITRTRIGKRFFGLWFPVA